MIVLGFLLASWLATREANHRNLPEIIYDLGVTMLLCGLIGGRLFHYIQFYGSSYAQDPWYKFFYLWEGGLVFQGGAFGGALGGLLFLMWKRAAVADYLDVVSPFVPLAMGFGRVGCFLNGCCHGERCASAFALGVKYPVGSLTYTEQLKAGVISSESASALPVFPIQLWEATMDLVLCGVLWWLCRRPFPRGGGMPLLFLFYGIERFGLELLRGDEEGRGLQSLLWTGISANFTIYQNISICIMLVFAGLFLMRWKRWR
jgi:phosphatidylglycerol:prolipoprotein diacylglycerol transferase